MFKISPNQREKKYPNHVMGMEPAFFSSGVT